MAVWGDVSAGTSMWTRVSQSLALWHSAVNPDWAGSGKEQAEPTAFQASQFLPNSEPQIQGHPGLVSFHCCDGVPLKAQSS